MQPAASPSVGESSISAINLVMPMAGRGLAFAEAGETIPKPLIKLNGRPMFWWAVESVRRCTAIEQMVFIVLEEHQTNFSIREKIWDYYPRAKVIPIPEVTEGQAETAAIGVIALETSGPFAVNDCDHAFEVEPIRDIVKQMDRRTTDGALIGFPSDDPSETYLHFDENGNIDGLSLTEVASPLAVAGCYFFADREDFFERMRYYRRDCPYPELIVPGLMDGMAQAGNRIGRPVLFTTAKRYVQFGTPEQLATVTPAMLDFLK